MTPAEITLVRDSFQKVAPIAPQAAALFYGRLFELDPSLRPLFKGDMTEQGKKLMATLALATATLDRPDQLLPVVRQLGVRHVAYGVRDEHYATVGAALLWTLEQGLGADFTPAVRAAWTATYTLLADTMITAARQRPEAGK
ncbi:MAG: globin family protein [Verrucomicrobiota bacterium]